MLPGAQKPSHNPKLPHSTIYRLTDYTQLNAQRHSDCTRLAMKRKADQVDNLEVAEQAKRRAPSQKDRFREGLFDGSVLEEYRKSYATSEP